MRKTNVFLNGRKRGLRVNNPIPDKLRSENPLITDFEANGDDKLQTKLAYLAEIYGNVSNDA